ncbi:MAG: TlpA disulfide reductase family protein [Bacteroidota bacterium]
MRKFIFGLFLLINLPYAIGQRYPLPQGPEPLPDLNLQDQDGVSVSLDYLEGKYVYVLIWSSWSDEAMDCFPALAYQIKQFAGFPVEFVTVNVDQEAKRWKKTLHKHSLAGTHYWAGPEQKIVEEFSLLKFPRAILIDPRGSLIMDRAPMPVRLSNPLKKLLAKPGIASSTN